MYANYYKETYSCYENMMYTIMRNLNKNHEMIFSECIGFHYHSVSEKENEIVLSAERGKVFANLERYSGLKIKVESLDKTDNLVEQICRNLDNGAICGVYLDLFWCSWCEGYHKYHQEHYIIIEDYDSEKEKFLCRDPHFQRENVYLEKASLQAGGMEILIIENSESVPIKQQDCYQLIRNSMKQMNEESFTQMRQFSKDIAQFNIGELLKDYESIDYCPWFIQFLRICWARKNYVEFLEYLNTVLPASEIESLKDEWMLVWNEWKLIKLMLTKCCVFPEGASKKLVKLSEKINEVADMEEKLYRKTVHFS